MKHHDNQQSPDYTASNLRIAFKAHYDCYWNLIMAKITFDMLDREQGAPVFLQLGAILREKGLMLPDPEWPSFCKSMDIDPDSFRVVSSIETQYYTAVALSQYGITPLLSDIDWKPFAPSDTEEIILTSPNDPVFELALKDIEQHYQVSPF